MPQSPDGAGLFLLRRSLGLRRLLLAPTRPVLLHPFGNGALLRFGHAPVPPPLLAPSALGGSLGGLRGLALGCCSFARRGLEFRERPQDTPDFRTERIEPVPRSNKREPFDFN
jgi:hypothetical protein